MTHVESFQCEAQKVIQSGTTDATRLQQLLDNGNTLDVDLPEIPKLKQVWLDSAWLHNGLPSYTMLFLVSSLTMKVTSVL